MEALFGNLDMDDEQYEVSIGTRVAYRCATLCHPGLAFTGKVWGEARWAMTMELQGLYALRNATVHEGELRPIAEQVLLERARIVVGEALMVVLIAAMGKGLASVEELLAWCEHE